MRILTIILVLFGLSGFAQHHMMSALASNFDLKTDLVSCWEMDEGSGSTVNDSYASNNGTSYNCTVNQTGILDKCYIYNGTSSYLNLGNIIPNSITISTWLYITNANIFEYFDRFKMDLFSDDIRWMITNNGIQYAKVRVSNVSAGEWIHIVVTWDSSIKENKLYANGVLSQTLTSTTGYGTLTTYPELYVGKRQQYNDNYFDGKIDQSAIWNEVLTAAQVAALYNGGNGLPYTEW